MQNITFDILDRTSMHLYYDKLYTTRRKRPALKALILLTDLEVEDLPKILSQEEKLSKSYFVNVAALGEELYRVSLQRTMGLREMRREVIIDAGHEGVWIVLTNAESYFVAHVLERFFNKLYPFVSRLYLNYSQMRLLLKMIREACQGKTTLTFFTIKRERMKTVEERVYPRKKGSEILWDVDVDEEIKRLLSDGFIVKVNQLEFVLKGEDDTILLKAQIARNGLSKLKFGSFSAFYENIVFKAIEYGLERKNFYDKRERNVEKGIIQLRPLQISYTFGFRTEQLSRFGKKIANSYSCSIIHGGNPYFVADLCDYEDGSSFSVAILGDSITVTPITRATPSAVWRLVDKIQEIMGDGEIVDVKPR
ncbi:MAG: hypothetical protein OEZ21_00700 [Candidatus Bathyarchaeota archaeon]|nr:hypothetical protein [Candidatus Bathyarchaeota archaeon]MDH5745461.1 hypothetical protein [Candidatus Bathyarchaeota archaeon]